MFSFVIKALYFVVQNKCNAMQDNDDWYMYN